MEQDHEERRRHPRFPCSGNAELRSLSSGARGVGKIENLSLGGCRIQIGHSHPFREGENVEMTFTVRQLPVRVQASIRQLPSAEAVGLAFTLISERGKRQLQSLIGELAEMRRPRRNDPVQPQPSPPSAGAPPPSAPEPREPALRRSSPIPIDRRPF